MEGQSRRVILLGEQSLLTQCGELLIAKGFEISVVVSKNSSIQDWCNKNSIQFVQEFSLLKDKYSEHSVDFVMSITNLKMLPEWLIKLGKQAINFHDGPLPKYAGLNAPVWAILNDEAEHGVTWHEMTSQVDEGRILSQKTFPIVPGETALSINAKCYQVALDTFGDLLEGLISGNLTPVEQNQRDRSYFGLSKRPQAGGLIDWNKSVEDVERLVRALDHGNYRNPLSSPKIQVVGKLFIIKQAKIHELKSDHAPGTLVDISSGSIKVACGNGILDITEISLLNGERVACIEQWSKDNDLTVGAVLSNVSAVVSDALDERLSQVSKYEEKWLEFLLGAEPVSLPYTNEGGASPSSGWQSVSLPLPANVLSSPAYQSGAQAFCLAICSSLLSRLNSKTDFSHAVKLTELDDISGYFESCLPLLVTIDDTQGFSELLEASRQGLEQFKCMGNVASDVWVREPALANHSSISNFPVKIDLAGDVSVDALSEDSNSELILSISDDQAEIRLLYNEVKLTEQAVRQLAVQFSVMATEVIAKPDASLSELSILSPEDVESFSAWNGTAKPYDHARCIHQLIEFQAEQTPDSIALAFENETLSYRELNGQANRFARLLVEKGVQPGQLIGVMLDRSIDMVLALIATHKVGCAYVPLDPVYPADRLRYMVDDSGLAALITETRHQDKLGKLDAQVIVHDDLVSTLESFSDENLNQTLGSDSLAYVIYTSGSTGKPKGVMVEHRNVVNFFEGMDQSIGTDAGVWLAVTSISFDISVLEIFWTLARGFKVVLYSDKNALGQDEIKLRTPLKSTIDFSLFYWNVADEESHHQPDKYQLLLEGARFADNNGFKAVWNPERHFASFGGLFPNPAVTCAALATMTKNVDLRAGSCVVPLHSPIRVAEEWAVVDNLSNGRVGMAVASGWAPPDFAIKPENYADAKNIMFESLDKVRRLWRGETVPFPGPTGDVEVRTLPRPIQKELPYWVTTAGNVDTFKRAAEAGANVLTHLLGQTFEEVQEKINAYREAWKAAGHSGQGTITLMLHTFIGESMEQVEEVVRQPMKDYLKSAMFLVKGAAWNFPTFKKMSDETGKTLDEFFETISDEDMDDLLEFAFQRYFRTSGLFGTSDSAVETVAKCLEIGVDEIACLIDYGIDTKVVMEHLPHLNRLKQNCAASVVEQASTTDPLSGYSIPELIAQHQVTHFQCTPSMATMLVSDAESKASLMRVQHMMIGGEAMPAPLAKSITSTISGRLSNMYGPTETTIWSSTCEVDSTKPISIGKPIANTQIYIVDQNLNALPAGVPGELVIGGDGVVRGYHERPDLTKERFVDGWKLTPESSAQRIYRTGDLARFGSDGTLMCLGRIDHQVKIRGYRIELGEIEALLQSHDTVRECAVILREDKAGDKRLVAYVRPQYEKHVDSEILKAHLSAQLPEFMVPAFYVEMPAMPLTPNGKLDRNALPEPIQQKHLNSDSFALPENDWENLVAEIWKEALGIPEVGRRDNFFDIGGHSLLVIQVLKELREHDKVTKAVQMTDLFRHTTVEALAKFIASETKDDTGTKAASSRVAARKAAMSRRRRR